ncbi:hypothetical protein [Luteolibacter luteus]|uniref:Uncharacterized protein n=1 Tax=Luteolibacter luteus TaxID=2728835 RepID=A0A858RD78_9BACT|nr:hypothetical protein [Luteolibacter luteus]QJE94682.1 hypothetical protein HHL09_02435 [Luteolibacter luteus]
MDSPYRSPKTQGDQLPVDAKDHKALNVARFLAICSILANAVILYLIRELRAITDEVGFKAGEESWVSMLTWWNWRLPNALVLGTALFTLALSFTGRRQPTLALAFVSMGLALLSLVGLFRVFQSSMPW